MKKIFYTIKRFEQTGLNCGPNSLSQLISFYDPSVATKKIISKTKAIKNIGTWIGSLGKTAITLGYKTKVTSWDLYVFDPTWFKLKEKKIANKLKSDLEKEKNTLLRGVLNSYIEYLDAGGLLEFKPLSKELLVKKIEKYPILVNLSSTYLYRKKRSEQKILGRRQGHSILVNGYNPKNDKFYVIDPWHSVPFSASGRYTLKSDELITAMLFAEACHDCAILEIYK